MKVKFSKTKNAPTWHSFKEKHVFSLAIPAVRTQLCYAGVLIACDVNAVEVATATLVYSFMANGN